MRLWSNDRNRSGFRVVILHFGLSSFVDLWTDKPFPGYHWQLRSEQFPPLPQQAQGTVLHRNLFNLYVPFPLFSASSFFTKLATEFIKATGVFHIHTETETVWKIAVKKGWRKKELIPRKDQPQIPSQCLSFPVNMPSAPQFYLSGQLLFSFLPSVRVRY